MNDILLRTRKERIEILTLNRPDQLNALSPDLLRALMSTAQDLAGADDVDCIVIRGAGRAFCAGVDIKGFMGAAHLPPEHKLPLDYGGQVISAFEALPQPVIAAVHGICFTGGLEIAMGADFIIAAETARFADTHAKWGMHASYGMTQRLPRRVGQQMAKDMMFTGRELSGPEAVAAGLATRCVPDAELDAVAMACARAVAERSASSVRWVKDQVRVGGELPLAEALAYEVSHRPKSGDNMRERLAAAGWGGKS